MALGKRVRSLILGGENVTVLGCGGNERSLGLSFGDNLENATLLCWRISSVEGA